MPFAKSEREGGGEAEMVVACRRCLQTDSHNQLRTQSPREKKVSEIEKAF